MVYAGFLSCFGWGIRGWSYSNFLASTVGAIVLKSIYGINMSSGQCTASSNGVTLVPATFGNMQKQASSQDSKLSGLALTLQNAHWSRGRKALNRSALGSLGGVGSESCRTVDDRNPA